MSISSWSAVFGGILALVALMTLRRLQTRDETESRRLRREVGRLAREILDPVEGLFPRPHGDARAAVKRTRPLWSELEDAGIQVGGQVERLARGAVEELKSWEVHTAAAERPRGDRSARGIEASRSASEARRLLVELIEASER